MDQVERLVPHLEEGMVRVSFLEEVMEDGALECR